MAITHRTFLVNLTVIVPADGDPELQTPRGLEDAANAAAYANEQIGTVAMSTMDQRMDAKRLRERNAFFFREQPRLAFYDPKLDARGDDFERLKADGDK